MSENWSEIFKAGVFHQGQNSFSESDVAELVETYDPNILEAPLTLDHIQQGEALGWVKGLKKVGDKLLALFEDVKPKLKELVGEGRYKKISSEIYPREHPDNPTPGRLRLKAVTFLGAAIPAVKGLAPVKLSETLIFCEACEVINIENPKKEDTNMDADLEKLKKENEEKDKAIKSKDTEIVALSERLKTLEASLAKQANQSGEAKPAIEPAKQDPAIVALSEKNKALEEQVLRLSHEGKVKEFLAFAEGLVDEGKLPPKMKEKVVFLLDSLEQMGVNTYAFKVDGTILKSGDYFSFSENGKEQKPAQVLMEILKGFPQVLEFKEQAKEGAGNDIDAKAMALMEKEKITYRQALKKASKGGK